MNMKKILMIMVIIFFSLCLIFLFLNKERIARKESAVDEKKKEQIIETSLPTPIKDEKSLKIDQFREEIRSIKRDIEKVEPEDVRLIPPEFILDLGVD